MSAACAAAAARWRGAPGLAGAPRVGAAMAPYIAAAQRGACPAAVRVSRPLPRRCPPPVLAGRMAWARAAERSGWSSDAGQRSSRGWTACGEERERCRQHDGRPSTSGRSERGGGAGAGLRGMRSWALYGCNGVALYHAQVRCHHWPARRAAELEVPRSQSWA